VSIYQARNIGASSLWFVLGTRSSSSSEIRGEVEDPLAPRERVGRVLAALLEGAARARDLRAVCAHLRSTSLKRHIRYR
jgi:hypothetical protein